MATISAPEGNPSLSHESSLPDLSSNAAFDGREVEFTRPPPSRAASIISRGSVDDIELPDEIVTAEGLRHSDNVLNAKRYKGKSFMDRLFVILQDLLVPTWSERIYPSNASISSMNSWTDVAPPSKDKVWIHKVSGSLTNAVFFVLVPNGPREQAKGFTSVAPYKTLLLRIYGPHSSDLINRAAELRILHVLSSRYRIGPRVYGTFGNGRVEEYFESEPLTAQELRDPQISRWIAVRMSELHRVDVRKVVDPVEWADPKDGTRGELGVKRNVRTWIPAAREVLKLIRNEEYKKEIDFELFVEQWTRYYNWVRDWEKEEDCAKQSPRVFCHNDTQYGNLLKLKQPQVGKWPHQQIIVVDFEYASPNSAAFDIANQFCEWTTDYLGPEPALMQPSKYPTRQERDNFYLAYLQSGLVLDGTSRSATRSSSSSISDQPPTTSTKLTSSSDILTESPASTPTTLTRTPSAAALSKTPPLAQFTKGTTVLPQAMDLLEEQVRRWMPGSHGMWAVWALVQGRENVEKENMRLDGKKQNGTDSDEEHEEDAIEFDYLKYASGRIRIFREACKEMGVF